MPKDKAIKRFIVRNMVDASAIRDLQDACAIDGGCSLSVRIYIQLGLLMLRWQRTQRRRSGSRWRQLARHRPLICALGAALLPRAARAVWPACLGGSTQPGRHTAALVERVAGSQHISQYS